MNRKRIAAIRANLRLTDGKHDLPGLSKNRAASASPCGFVAKPNPLHQPIWFDSAQTYCLVNVSVNVSP